MSKGDMYDVLIIGGGHAGCEAALAAARMGCATLLAVINADTIGAMSCNPAIGGLAKGHLVKEIDALGGEMGKNIDATGIQFRRLNVSRGPAVRATRAQSDARRYKARMANIIESEDLIDVVEGEVVDLLVADRTSVEVKGGGGVGVSSGNRSKSCGRRNWPKTHSPPTSIKSACPGLIRSQ